MKKWSFNLKSLGLDVKKTKSKLIAFALLSLGVSAFFLYQNNWFFGILPLALYLFGFLAFYFYIDQAIKEDKKQKDEEFATIFTYFRIYSQHGRNVYQALQLASNHASTSMRFLLENLISNIEKDTSVRPFLEFARHFSHPLIEEIAIAMYQMIDTGRNERYLWQFNYLFNKYETLVSEQHHEQKARRLERINLSALLGAAVLVLALALGIIQLIGGLMNGV